MWCYCTSSSHHDCNESIGKVMCKANIEHCLIGRSGSKFIQSCWEWSLEKGCPDIIDQCYIIGTNMIQPVCCCKGQLCNSLNVTMEPNPNLFARSTGSFLFSTPKTEQISSFIIPGIILLVCLIIIFSVISFLITRIFCSRNIKCSRPSWNEYNTENCELISKSYFENNLIDKCTKEKLIAHGRFGQVWSGKIILDQNQNCQTNIAIKIFSNNAVNRRSWENESLIYSILRSRNHPNILYCYGAEKVMKSEGLEMWLVVQYHSIGSLWAYLKQFSINWETLLCISQNIASGISHLHSFNQRKILSISHRDIKSKNILLKSNLSACIADFGLAICQKNDKTCINSIVGTYNYMAPEILEGSINLTILSFLPVDIFSMSLVFWELLNRCLLPGMKSASFIFAFERIVGEKPTLDDMRNCVVRKKLRPEFNEYWSNFSAVMIYWETICECWDEDPDARLNAECVKVRLDELLKVDIGVISELTGDNL